MRASMSQQSRRQTFGQGLTRPNGRLPLIPRIPSLHAQPWLGSSQALMNATSLPATDAQQRPSTVKKTKKKTSIIFC